MALAPHLTDNRPRFPPLSLLSLHMQSLSLDKGTISPLPKSEPHSVGCLHGPVLTWTHTAGLGLGLGFGCCHSSHGSRSSSQTCPSSTPVTVSFWPPCPHSTLPTPCHRTSSRGILAPLQSMQEGSVLSASPPAMDDFAHCRSTFCCWCSQEEWAARHAKWKHVGGRERGNRRAKPSFQAPSLSALTTRGGILLASLFVFMLSGVPVPAFQRWHFLWVERSHRIDKAVCHQGELEAVLVCTGVFHMLTKLSCALLLHVSWNIHLFFFPFPPYAY